MEFNGNKIEINQDIDYKKEIAEMLKKANNIQLYCLHKLVKSYLTTK